MTRRIVGLILTVALAGPWTGVALAQNAQSRIPLGTRITVQNWQQYKDYMSVGLQALLSGKYHWKVPDGAVLEVGPTQSYPLPPKFWQDTEKYGSQVKLRQLPNGGYTIEGYVAGEPFRNPSGPLAGEELLYDLYYNYTPAVQYTAEAGGHVIDRFDSDFEETTFDVFRRLSHVSDIGWDVTTPGAAGVYFSFFVQEITPEQAKYTSSLQNQYDDVLKFPDVYVFLPSLRRSLRLSTAARCAPLLGSDFTNDDTSPVPLPPTIDQGTLLGEKRILAAWGPNLSADGTTYKDFANNFYYPSFWPKEVLGVKWQLRDVWLLEIKRVPSKAAGYCYGKKIYYIDKEFYGSLEVDSYDPEMKLWKVFCGFRTPTPVPGGGVFAVTAGENNVYDLQNQHASIGWQTKVLLNSDAPSQYHDVARYALPAGLLQIMQ